MYDNQCSQKHVDPRKYEEIVIIETIMWAFWIFIFFVSYLIS